MKTILPNAKDILFEILTIIDYKDNKEKFAKEFLTVELQQAFSDEIAHLSKEQKEDLEVQLATNPSDAEIYQLLEGYLTPKVYASIFLQSTQKFFADYIQTILPFLTTEKKEKLQRYIISVATQFQNTLTSLSRG